MGPIDLLIHLSGFVAPALALGLALPLACRVFLPRHRIVTGFLTQIAVVACAGIAVLLAGLWFFGRDGKMATYGALVLAAASVQWVLARGWR